MRRPPNTSPEVIARRRAMLEGLSWQDKVTVIANHLRGIHRAHEVLLAEVLATEAGIKK